MILLNICHHFMGSLCEAWLHKQIICEREKPHPGQSHKLKKPYFREYFLRETKQQLQLNKYQLVYRVLYLKQLLKATEEPKTKEIQHFLNIPFLERAILTQATQRNPFYRTGYTEKCSSQTQPFDGQEVSSI